MSDDYYVDDSLGGNQGGADGSDDVVGSTTQGAGGSSTQSSTSSSGAGGSSSDAGGTSSDAGGTSSDAGGTSSDVGGSTSDAGGTSGSGGNTSDAGGTSGSGGSTSTDAGGTGGSGSEATSTTSPTCGCNAGRGCEVGSCTPGWLSMAEPPEGFVERRYSAVAAFEGKVFIWGGIDSDENPLDDGAIYDPRSDTWSLVAIDSATPSPRERAVAVWTGSHVLVVGGLSDDGYEQDAALYDPEADEWIPTDSAMIPRSQGVAGVVDGVVVLLEGFTTDGDAAGNPERYDIDSGTWSRAGDEGDLPYQWSEAIGFTDHEVIVFGGNSEYGRSDATYSYDVDQDDWTDLPATLSDRSGSFGAWDGSQFYVWGGHDGDYAYDDGSIFEAGNWSSLPESGAPSERRMPPNWAGWAFAAGPGDFVVIGGVSASDITLLDSGRYRDDGGWEAIEAYPSGASHAGGAGVWTGEEFVLWSGLGVDDVTLAPIGDRWAP